MGTEEAENRPTQDGNKVETKNESENTCQDKD